MAWLQVAEGVLIPFLGTSLGAACVFFMRKELNEKVKKILAGFAAGIMVSASFFSLILPAIEQAGYMGKLSFLPAVVGFIIGMLFLLVLDKVVPHVHLDHSEEGLKTGLKKTTKLMLAVTLHNLPEGMAAGAVFAALGLESYLNQLKIPVFASGLGAGFCTATARLWRIVSTLP